MAGVLLATGFSYVNSLKSLKEWWRGLIREWKRSTDSTLFLFPGKGGGKRTEAPPKTKTEESRPKTAATPEIPVIHDFSEKEETSPPPPEQPELFPKQKVNTKASAEKEAGEEAVGSGSTKNRIFPSIGYLPSLFWKRQKKAVGSRITGE